MNSGMRDARASIEKAAALGRLSDKVTIVTGAGTAMPDVAGVGGAIAMLFALEGSRIAVLNRSAAPASVTVAMINDAGGSAISITADVSREEDCKRAVTATLEAFGRTRCVGEQRCTRRIIER